MRFLLWKALCAAALCAPLLAAAQQQPSDYAREKRWADEVLPSIVVGEAVWLEAPRTEKFLGIYTESKDAKRAIILVHGLGLHPDYGLIGDLRTRLAAAMTFLRRKRYDKIVVVSHSMGSRMANHYISAHPQVPLAGLISLSISSGDIGPFKRIKFPVYDVYAENDFDLVLQGAQKRAAVLKRMRGSSQTMVFATDHYFAKREKELVILVRLLLEGEKK